MKTYWVYIMTNKNRRVLYTGITNDIERRVQEHKAKVGSNFTTKNNCTILLYFEDFGNVAEAIQREKQIKNWKRVWKEALINEKNPNWDDLALDWFCGEDLEAMRFESQNNR